MTGDEDGRGAAAAAAPVAGAPSPAAAGADATAASAPVPRSLLAALAGPDCLLRVEDLQAGYGEAPVLRGFDMQVGVGQSVCLVGPNGAGKSTVLNAVYGLCGVLGGRVEVDGRDVGHLPPHARLLTARVSYLLQDSSIFPDMTVEENLLLGGYLMPRPADAREAAEAVLQRHPLLAERRRQPARVLSGGERRVLEIARALIMDPRILLVDEPSIGLDGRAARMVFDVLRDLQHGEGRTVVVVEQNVRLGLAFADVGYLLVSGRAVAAAPGAELLRRLLPAGAAGAR